MMFRDAHAQLLERRARVESLVAQMGPAPQLEDLIGQIDAALARFDAGTYGLCEACHDPIEPDRLSADPLATLCLDHLAPSESRALEKDLELAAQVQVTLLPSRDLAAGRWQIAYDYLPLGSVSGDCVDVIRPGDGPGADPIVLLGDIAGKGVAASMLMAHLHASLRTLAGVGLPRRTGGLPRPGPPHRRSHRHGGQAAAVAARPPAPDAARRRPLAACRAPAPLDGHSKRE